MSQISDKTSILHLASTKQKEIIRHVFTESELNDRKDQISKNLMKLLDL